MEELSSIAKRQEEWQETALKKSIETSPEREIITELPKQRLYTPLDLAGSDYVKDIGFPGEYP